MLGCDGHPEISLQRTKEHFRRLFHTYGLPFRIRTDNGAPFASNALARLSQLSVWFIKLGIYPELIEPGKPQQNAYVERYNRTVRYDWLNQYIFETIEEVQEAATAWLWTYNNERPNMAIGGITPKQKLARAMPIAA